MTENEELKKLIELQELQIKQQEKKHHSNMVALYWVVAFLMFILPAGWLLLPFWLLFGLIKINTKGLFKGDKRK